MQQLKIYCSKLIPPKLLQGLTTLVYTSSTEYLWSFSLNGSMLFEICFPQNGQYENGISSENG